MSEKVEWRLHHESQYGHFRGIIQGVMIPMIKTQDLTHWLQDEIVKFHNVHLYDSPDSKCFNFILSGQKCLETTAINNLLLINWADKLAPNRWQAINSITDNLGLQHHVASVGHKELKSSSHWGCFIINLCGPGVTNLCTSNHHGNRAIIHINRFSKYQHIIDLPWAKMPMDSQ